MGSTSVWRIDAGSGASISSPTCFTHLFQVTLLIDNLYQQVLMPSGVTEHKFTVGNAIVTRRTAGGPQVYYLHKDQQGSTTAITNPEGNTVQQLLYDPWGKQYQVSPNALLYSSQATTYGYTGHDMVNDFEVIHMGGRTYNPVLGRFMQADPSGTLLLSDGPNGQTRYIHLGKELIAKVGSAAALEDKPGYTGHVEDKDLSLTYMQQRYYDPVIGRFYSNDPVGFSADNPMMFNRYAYANNNPYKFTDPDGEFPVIQAVAFAVGFVAGGVNEVMKGNTDLGSVAKGAVLGGVVGVASTFGGGVIGSSLAGSAASALGETASQALSGGEMNTGDIKQAAIEGALGGALGKIGAKAVVPSRGLPNNTGAQAGNNMTASGSQRILADSKTLSTTPANRSGVEAKAGAAYAAGTSTGKALAEDNNEKNK